MDIRWIETSELASLVSSHKGKPLLLNHWATWCDPCVGELPILGDLHKAHGEEITFLGLSWDRFEQFTDEAGTAKAIEETCAEHGLAYDMAIFRGSPEELFEALELEQRLIPQTFLYDAEGREVFHYMGSLEEPGAEAQLREAVEKL